jgi:N-carbamoylputrescine amidase
VSGLPDFAVEVVNEVPASPLRHDDPAERATFRVGLVQAAYDPDPERHRATLRHGIEIAARHGAGLVCLQELTLSPYFAVHPGADVAPESLEDGPTRRFAAEAARATGVHVHASLFEAVPDEHATLGYNTAIVVAPDGALAAATRKLHIPRFDGYHEDRYFLPGEPDIRPTAIAGAQVGLPTCWDQWFPELARAYGLAGAELLVYPTAIGSEPGVPDFDSQPIWEQVIRANGITAATFMVAVNRIGAEGPLTFYGSSFISDPYGRVLARAPRDRPAVLVAALDLDQRRDWLRFGLMDTRRPEVYGPLVQRTAVVA